MRSFTLAFAFWLAEIAFGRQQTILAPMDVPPGRPRSKLVIDLGCGSPTSRVGLTCYILQVKQIFDHIENKST
jgi:hypothetical protein